MKETIKSFAVELLGCGCSNDVFDSIDISDAGFGHALTGCKRILIGGRLLIYLVPWNERSASSETISFLMGRGKKERDSMGYNRFRLVLAAPMPERVISETRGMVDSLIGDDEKLHFHVLSADNTLVKTILC